MIAWRATLSLAFGAAVSFGVAAWACNVEAVRRFSRAQGDLRCGNGLMSKWNVWEYRRGTACTSIDLYYFHDHPSDPACEDRAALEELSRTESHSVLERTVSGDPVSAWWYVRMGGWPVSAWAAAASEAHTEDHQPGHSYVVVRKPIMLSIPGRADPLVIPTLPLWRGLAIDTVLYASAFGSLFGWGPIRNVRRRCRGLCPKCAYDLRGNLHIGCPECGWGRASADQAQRTWNT